MFEHLKQKYLSSFDDKIKTIEQAVHSSDAQSLSTIVHQMAGSSGSYGFEALSELCIKIEDQIIQGADFQNIIQPEVNNLLAQMKSIKSS